VWYRLAQEQDFIQNFISFYENKYPGITLRITEFDNKIKLDKIEVPKDLRNQGIGTEIITALKEYSQRVSKPIVLNPEPEKGKKGALQRFYERNEFVDNAGRRKDYDLTDTFSRTMYYKPK
jgi:GNAT superfamily N-acetyltransferase